MPCHKDYMKLKRAGRCVKCGREKEKNGVLACNSCTKKNIEWFQRKQKNFERGLKMSDDKRDIAEEGTDICPNCGLLEDECLCAEDMRPEDESDEDY